MQEKTKGIHEEITHIQNMLWTMYKEFLRSYDMAGYNHKAQELEEEYTGKGDRQLLSFCQNLLISWAPVMNRLAEDFRNTV